MSQQDWSKLTTDYLSEIREEARSVRRLLSASLKLQAQVARWQGTYTQEEVDAVEKLVDAETPSDDR